MLIRNDAQVRVEEHLMGKMHMGFAKIQVTIKELKVSRFAKFSEMIRKNFFIFCGSHNQSTPLALLEAKQVPQILNTLESKKYIHFPSKFKQN